MAKTTDKEAKDPYADKFHQTIANRAAGAGLLGLTGDAPKTARDAGVGGGDANGGGDTALATDKGAYTEDVGAGLAAELEESGEGGGVGEVTVAHMFDHEGVIDLRADKDPQEQGTVAPKASPKPKAKPAPLVKRMLFLKAEHIERVGTSADRAGLYKRIWFSEFLGEHVGSVGEYIPAYESRGPKDKEVTVRYSVDLPKDVLKRVDSAAGKYADGDRSRFVRHLFDSVVEAPRGL